MNVRRLSKLCQQEKAPVREKRQGPGHFGCF
jgi:hypothetical protein